MNRDKMIEAMASMIEDYRCGRDGKTAKEAAAAVLELVGPEKLVWESPCEANNRCHIARTARGDYYVDVDGGRHQAWMESLTKPYEVQIGEPVGDMFAAQSAAQAHADAAHWANTPIEAE